MDDTFICAMCGGEFAKGWTDDEAEAELKKNFGEKFTRDMCDRVCDDCYNKVKPSANPERFADFQTKTLKAQLKALMRDRAIEGIVWHHPNGRIIKIKRKDFSKSRGAAGDGEGGQ